MDNDWQQAEWPHLKRTVSVLYQVKRMCEGFTHRAGTVALLTQSLPSSFTLYHHKNHEQPLFLFAHLEVYCGNILIRLFWTVPGKLSPVAWTPNRCQYKWRHRAAYAMNRLLFSHQCWWTHTLERECLCDRDCQVKPSADGKIRHRT